MDKNGFLVALNDLGTQVIDLVRQGLDAAKTAIPQFIGQAMAYWITMAWLNFAVTGLVAVGMIVASAILFRKYRMITEYEQEEDEARREQLERLYYSDKEVVCFVFSLITAGVGIIIALFFVFDCIPEVVKFLTAPSLFFIDHAKELFK